MTTPAPPTATLAAWLEQQVAADEALAMAALSEWSSEALAYGVAVEMSSPRLSPEQAIWPYGDQARRVADWLLASGVAQDPAQTLRRIASIRQVLALHGPHDHATLPWVCASCAEGYEGHGTGTDWHERVPSPCPTLRALASMYADRDGYRAEEWRP